MEVITYLFGLVVVLALVGLWFQQKEVERLKDAVTWRDKFEAQAVEYKQDSLEWKTLHKTLMEDHLELGAKYHAIMQYKHAQDIAANIAKGTARKK